MNECGDRSHVEMFCCSISFLGFRSESVLNIILFFIDEYESIEFFGVVGVASIYGIIEVLDEGVMDMSFFSGE